jgi:hypothetical protein
MRYITIHFKTWASVNAYEMLAVTVLQTRYPSYTCEKHKFLANCTDSKRMAKNERRKTGLGEFKLVHAWISMLVSGITLIAFHSSAFTSFGNYVATIGWSLGLSASGGAICRTVRQARLRSA